MKNTRLIYIVCVSFLIIIVLYISDQILQLSYISKVIIKVTLFSLFPLIYIRVTKDNFLKDSLVQNKMKFRIKLSHVLGILIFITILVVFQLVKQYIDIGVLLTEFEEKYKINKGNILYYGIYLAFVNSLLEEFFFRGFIFLNLKKLGMKRIGHLTSSSAFAIYHISNFQNWFTPWVFVLAMTGLFIGGLVFNYLADYENTFLNSWFVHICADLAIVGIGLRLFHVI